MNLENHVQENSPNNRKRLSVMITQTQLIKMVNQTQIQEGKNPINPIQLFKILNNEKK